MPMNSFIVLSLILGSAFLLITLFWVQTNGKLKETTKSLDYFKKLCDELDQNTKIIIQQDLELSRTHEALNKRAYGLFALHQLGKKMGSVFDETPLAQLVTDSITEAFGFEKSAFFIVAKADSPFSCLASRGFHEPEVLKPILLSIEQLLRNGGGGLLGTTDSSDTNVQKIISELKLDTFILTPIDLKTDRAGAILVGNSLPYEKIGTEERDLVSLLADQVAVVLENARLYEQLRKTHHLLEVRVQERTRELEKLNQQLKHISVMKSDFVSSASHELRTPLTSIKGYSSILISGKLGVVTPEQQARLEKINLHVNELMEMINTLLDISRIERGKTEMKLEPFSLKELISKVVDLLQPQYMARKIQSQVILPENIEPILGDVPQLQRVLINLLSNALKYTPDEGNGIIVIEIQPFEKEYRIAIKDNGMGIPEESLPKLFTEFYRVDTPETQAIKGTGLGLSLVKKILEAHKGAIWVESVLGKGTTFYFTLPLSQLNEGNKDV